MFAGAARGAVFSNPDVVKRVNASFVPVALKAATVNHPPGGDEGRLYREIGRSKPAPQGICVANSAGKVLAWSLMFEDDAAVLGFLDHALRRYGLFPGAEKPVAAERFMKFPGAKMSDVADGGEAPALPEAHAAAECLGTLKVPPGTLRGRAYGRAYKDGKPLQDTTRQDHYVEDRFEIDLGAQQALARAAGDRFAIPDGIARALVSTAYLGMLDVNPLEVPGGENDQREWEFRGRRERGRILFEGTSRVAGGSRRGGRDSDGRHWTHEVALTWKGSIEQKDGRVVRLVAVANGPEKLRWGNDRMIRPGRSEVSQLPGGRLIEFDGEARYGFVASED